MNGVQNFNDKFRIAFTSDTKKFENKLKELNIDVNSIECIGCKTRLDVDKIRGVYNHKDKTFFFCGKSKCQIEAYHKLLDLE